MCSQINDNNDDSKLQYNFKLDVKLKTTLNLDKYRLSKSEKNVSTHDVV